MNNADMPAMPVATLNAGGNKGPEIYAGLSKRELIAAMAMQGLIANPNPIVADSAEEGNKLLAEGAVQIADALLAELEER